MTSYQVGIGFVLFFLVMCALASYRALYVYKTFPISDSFWKRSFYRWSILAALCLTNMIVMAFVVF